MVYESQLQRFGQGRRRGSRKKTQNLYPKKNGKPLKIFDFRGP